MAQAAQKFLGNMALVREAIIGFIRKSWSAPPRRLISAGEYVGEIEGLYPFNWTVANFGTVLGIYLQNGGSVTNGAEGATEALIRNDGWYGVRLQGSPGTVTNFGTIEGEWAGVLLGAAGTLTNFGTIEASDPYHSDVGVVLYNGGTVVNAGTIGSADGTAVFLGGTGNLLNVQPGAVFEGTVAGFDAGDTIDFAGVVATSAMYSGGILTLENGGVDVGQLRLSTPYVMPIFSLTDDGGGGTSVMVTAGGPNPGVIFSGSYTSGLPLGIQLNDPKTQNPATIAATGTVWDAYGPGIGGASGYTWTLTNLGTIASFADVAVGVQFPSGGTVTNGASDNHQAEIAGEVSLGNSSTVVNFGTIQGTGFPHHGTSNGGAGVRLGSGSVVNNAGALIAGGIYGFTGGNGVAFAGTGTLYNAGTIVGALPDWHLNPDLTAVELAGGGTVFNSGTIIGGPGTLAVSFGGTGTNLLVLQGSYSIIGGVSGSTGATNTVELQGNAAAPVAVHFDPAHFVNFGTAGFAPGPDNYATLTLGDTSGLPQLITGFTGPHDFIDLPTLSDVGGDATVSFDRSTDVLTVTGDNGIVSLQLDNEDYGGQIWLASQDGHGGTQIAVGPPPAIENKLLGDYNGDGNADLLWRNIDGQAYIWELLGTDPAGGGSLGNPGSSWKIRGSGDFNADGYSDILWQNDDGQADIWLMRGTTPLVQSFVGPNPGPGWHIVGTGDFYGDGHADILWQNDDGEADIWKMRGTRVVGGGSIGNPGPDWHIEGTGDFNGDGHTDILWQNDDGQAAIWLMRGTTPIAESLVGPNPGPSWHVKTTGDFNGDGKADILWQNDSGAAYIWEMDGKRVIGGGLLGNPGPSWHIEATGDVNGDGMSDILWQNADGQADIWLMQGTTPLVQSFVGPNPGPRWHL